MMIALLQQRNGVDRTTSFTKVLYSHFQRYRPRNVITGSNPRGYLWKNEVLCYESMSFIHHMPESFLFCRNISIRTNDQQISQRSARQRQIGLYTSIKFYSKMIECNRKQVCRSLSTEVERNSFDPKIEEYLVSQNLLDDFSIATMQKRIIYAKIIRSLEPVYGKGQVKVSHLKSFGAAGLKALVASILQEEAATLTESTDQTKRPVITVRFKVPHHKTEFDLPWYYATIQASNQASTLLDLKNDSTEGAALLSEYIGASCGGNCSCATCHVYIETKVDDTNPSQCIELSPLSEAEQDMLDLAYQPTDQSRLACQVRIIKLPTNLDPQSVPYLNVTIPSGVNDFWN